MRDPYFVIESEGGTVYSNEIQSEGIGVEITSSFTGGGLPPVVAQFDEGLGNGSTYRGTRAQSRSLDFTAHCFGPSRAHLRSIVDRLSMVLAYACTVTFVDPDEDETWSVTAARTGGGDYAYGSDSDAGLSYVNIEWTMQSESPFWVADSLTRVADEDDEVETENYGTLPVPGIWRVTGPTNGFTITDEDDNVLEFTGFIPEGQTVTVDGTTGLVTDSSGANRYTDLQGDPVFRVPVGEQTFTFGWDQDSLEFTSHLTRTNHVKNSSFVLDPETVGDWTIPEDYDWNEAGGTVRFRSFDERTTAKPKILYDLVGLTAGKAYQVRILLNQRLGPYGVTFPTNGFLRVLDSDGGQVANMAVVPPRVGGYLQFDDDNEVVLDFTATETSHQVKFHPAFVSTAGSGVDPAPGKYYEGSRVDDLFSRPTIRRMSVAEPGPYFDGNDTDTDTIDYEFTGDPDETKSTETTTYTELEPIEGAGLAMEVEYSPQRWLVI